MCGGRTSGGYSQEALYTINAAQNVTPRCADPRTSEQVMVDMIREDLGVVIDPQAWRMFIRHRFGRISPLAHRIHDGKR